MKFTAAAAILATFFSGISPVTAWTFVDGARRVYDGKGNKACTAEITNAGQEFSWDRGFFEDCCIRLYQTSSCGTQAAALEQAAEVRALLEAGYFRAACGRNRDTEE
ncbi:MAG: hypothetical protein L6R42_005872 [Xanthoria sp. 1 TBL-2021]|nr:MAG: hypothetical protein L6R42_005872 [Xanthoria sp. 1 TBL-2021]